MLTRMDKDAVRMLRTEMTAAVTSVAQKHGVTIKGGNATFGDAEATIKFHIKPTNLEAGVETKAVKDYKLNAMIHNLPPIGSIVTIMGTDYKITGWNSRAKKYPITATQVQTRKGYKLGVNYVKMGTVK